LSFLLLDLVSTLDGVASDLVISVSSVQSGAISRPRERGGERKLSVLASRRVRHSDLIDQNLRFQIPNLNRSGGSSAEPVSVGGEGHSVDHITSIEVVEDGARGQIPQVGNAIFATRSTETAIGGDGNSVHIVGVTLQIVEVRAVSGGPDLHKTIPASGHNDFVVRRRESHAGNPVGVRSRSQGVLALTKSVPKLDRSVSSATYDLSVVRGESHRHDILGVARESSKGIARFDFPKLQGSVPGRSEGKLAIYGDSHVRDEVRVAGQSSNRESIIFLMSSQLPNKDGVVSGRGEKSVGVLGRDGEGSHPTAVSFQCTSKIQVFTHDLTLFKKLLT
jgi:hypothetical protein